MVDIRFRPIAYMKAVNKAKRLSAQIDGILAGLNDEHAQSTARLVEVNKNVEKLMARRERVKPQNLAKVDEELSAAQLELSNNTDSLDHIIQLMEEKEAERQLLSRPVVEEYFKFDAPNPIKTVWGWIKWAFGKVVNAVKTVVRVVRKYVIPRIVWAVKQVAGFVYLGALAAAIAVAAAAVFVYHAAIAVAGVMATGALLLFLGLGILVQLIVTGLSQIVWKYHVYQAKRRAAASLEDAAPEQEPVAVVAVEDDPLLVA
jgi:hypothetical protein